MHGRARVPWAALLALALFCLTDQTFWRSERVLAVSLRYTPRGPKGDPLIVDAALRGMPRTDASLVTLMGSSQVREGLDCDVFESALPGRPCRSLAISGGTPLDALYIQGRLGERPRTTVLALFPKLLHMAPKAPFTDLESLRVALGARTGWSMGRGIWGPIAFGLLQRLCPTLRHKDAVWALWREVRPFPLAHWRLEPPPVSDQVLAHQGRQLPQYFANRVGVLDRDTQLGPFTPLQHAALERFLEREREGGRRPIVVDFPAHPDYPTTLPADVRADYGALLARLAARPDIRFVRAEELPALTREDFLDFVHLGPRGRAVVSARLAEIVAAETGTRDRALR